MLSLIRYGIFVLLIYCISQINITLYYLKVILPRGIFIERIKRAFHRKYIYSILNDTRLIFPSQLVNTVASVNGISISLSSWNNSTANSRIWRISVRSISSTLYSKNTELSYFPLTKEESSDCKELISSINSAALPSRLFARRNFPELWWNFEKPLRPEYAKPKILLFTLGIKRFKYRLRDPQLSVFGKLSTREHTLPLEKVGGGKKKKWGTERKKSDKSSIIPYAIRYNPIRATKSKSPVDVRIIPTAAFSTSYYEFPAK